MTDEVATEAPVRKFIVIGALLWALIGLNLVCVSRSCGDSVPDQIHTIAGIQK